MMTPESKKTKRALKSRNMNVKFTEEDYDFLQSIADDLGGMSLSNMIRTLVHSQIEEVKRTKDPRSFLNIVSGTTPVIVGRRSTDNQ